MTFTPFTAWFKDYSLRYLRADFISGLTVALVLIPQSMAYAQLADLPAYYGLYAAFLPPIVAALFGSSRQLATGPVAIVSLMTATALAPLATAGSENFVAYAILLALLVGLFQFLLGVLRLGVVVNFLSHPVVNGFTNAAALIIATSQLASLFGVTVDKGEHHYQTVYNVLRAVPYSTHWPTLGLAALAFIIIFGVKRINPRLPNVLFAVLITTALAWGLKFERVTRTGVESLCQVAQDDISEYNRILASIDSALAQRIELGMHIKGQSRCQLCHNRQTSDDLTIRYNITLSDLKINHLKEEVRWLRLRLQNYVFAAYEDSQSGLAYCLNDSLPPDTKNIDGVWRLKVGARKVDTAALTLAGGGSVVGKIPKGLPKIRPPKIDFNIILSLLPMVIVIALLGFMEAISIAKAMAARTGQRLDPNQELVGQGLANIVGSFTQGYPVSGSFSRSAVNLQSGAVTGLSNVIASLIVLVTLLFLTPVLYHLPQAALAAIIMMAVIGLINVRGFLHAWQAQPYDGFIAIVTFVTTLAFAPHLDKGIIVGVALSLGHFLLRNIKPDMAILAKFRDNTYRNADRRHLQKCQHLAVVRFNNSLIFANVNYLEEEIQELTTTLPQLRHIHIVGNGINELDASGEETLSKLVNFTREAGLDISLSGLNENVLDVMKRTHLYDKIGEDHLFGNVALAVEALYDRTHQNSTETRCPLREHLPQCQEEFPTSPNAKSKKKPTRSNRADVR